MLQWYFQQIESPLQSSNGDGRSSVEIDIGTPSDEGEETITSEQFMPGKEAKIGHSDLSIAAELSLPDTKPFSFIGWSKFGEFCTIHSSATSQPSVGAYVWSKSLGSGSSIHSLFQSIGFVNS